MKPSKEETHLALASAVRASHSPLNVAASKAYIRRNAAASAVHSIESSAGASSPPPPSISHGDGVDVKENSPIMSPPFIAVLVVVFVALLPPAPRAKARERSLRAWRVAAS